MENEAPPETKPEELSRAPTAWLLLALLFATLIGLTVTELRAPSMGNAKHPYLTQEATVRVAMKQRSLVSLFGALAGSKSMPSVSSVDEPTLESLARSAKTDPKAARLYVSTLFESGRSITKKQLALLPTPGTSADRNFARIYGAPKLSPEQARALSSELPKDEFASQLARIHAFDKAGDSTPRRAFSPAWKATGVLIMLLGFVVALPVGVIAWVLYFHFRSLGRLQPKGHPAEPLSYAEADRFAYRAVLLIGTFLTISLFFSMFPDMPTAQRLFLSFGIMASAVAAIHFVPVMGMDLPLSRVGVSRENLLKNVLWGVAGYLASLPGILIAALIGQQLMHYFGQSSHPATDLMESSPSAGTVISLLFAAALVAPFWEEIMFRGTLLPALTKVLGKPVWAILASSFLFAGIHPQGIPLWLGLGFIGAMNCMLAYQTRSLIPSMVLHCLNNALIIVFTVFLF